MSGLILESNWNHSMTGTTILTVSDAKLMYHMTLKHIVSLQTWQFPTFDASRGLSPFLQWFAGKS